VDEMRLASEVARSPAALPAEATATETAAPMATGAAAPLPAEPTPTPVEEVPARKTGPLCPFGVVMLSLGAALLFMARRPGQG
jgi:hypothetical protein